MVRFTFKQELGCKLRISRVISIDQNLTHISNVKIAYTKGLNSFWSRIWIVIPDDFTSYLLWYTNKRYKDSKNIWFRGGLSVGLVAVWFMYRHTQYRVELRFQITYRINYVTCLGSSIYYVSKLSGIFHPLLPMKENLYILLKVSINCHFHPHPTLQVIRSTWMVPIPYSKKALTY